MSSRVVIFPVASCSHVVTCRHVSLRVVIFPSCVVQSCRHVSSFFPVALCGHVVTCRHFFRGHGRLVPAACVTIGGTVVGPAVSSGVIAFWRADIALTSGRRCVSLGRVVISMASSRSEFRAWGVTMGCLSPILFIRSCCNTKPMIITTVISAIIPSVVQYAGEFQCIPEISPGSTVKDERRIFSTLSRSIQCGLLRCWATDSWETVVDKLNGRIFIIGSFITNRILRCMSPAKVQPFPLIRQFGGIVKKAHPLKVPASLPGQYKEGKLSPHKLTLSLHWVISLVLCLSFHGPLL